MKLGSLIEDIMTDYIEDIIVEGIGNEDEYNYKPLGIFIGQTLGIAMYLRIPKIEEMSLIFNSNDLLWK